MNDFLGEFLGTAVLILLGDGVVAGVLLNRSKAQNGGWIVVTAGWAFAVMAGVFVARAAHAEGFVNPVGPLASLVVGQLSADRAALCVAGEFLGAFTGAVLVWAHYFPHWKETTDPGLKLAVFCTGPAVRMPLANLLSEAIGTFALVFIGGAFVIEDFNKAPGFAVPFAAALVWAIGLSLGGTTGYAINPARDLAPRLAHALLPIPGKGGSDWGYAWVPVLGPVLGAVPAVLLAKEVFAR
jgi:glycerol uptake facilitator protein